MYLIMRIPPATLPGGGHLPGKLSGNPKTKEREPMKQNTDRQEARRQLMLTQPVGSVIFRMAIPTIVAFLIQSIYSLADTYFVSNLGASATAAVSVNSALDQMIMM